MADDLPDAPWSTKEELPDAPWGNREAADHGLSERQKLSPIGKALSPITSYPETYQRMNQEAQEQVAHGVKQLTAKDNGAWETAKGAGNVALGSVGYVASPISAAYRSVVGQPVEDVTGIPREYTEFGAQLATPGIGIPKLPMKTLPKPIPLKPEPNGPLGVTLSEGQMTHDMPAVRRESAARTGQLGPQAERTATEFAEQQRPQVEAARETVERGMDPTGGQVIASSPYEAAELAGETFRKEAARTKAGVTEAYDKAKNLPGEIEAQAVVGLGNRVKNTLAEMPDVIIDDQLTPFASKMIQSVDDTISKLQIQNRAELVAPDRMEIAGVTLRGIDQVRKKLSEFRRGAYGNNSTDGRAASAVMDAFDNTIDQAINSGAFRGDPRAIKAWNDARASHADYKTTFGKGKNDPVGRVMEKIIGDRTNPAETANALADHLYGASGVNPSDLNIGVAKRMQKVLGPESPEWAAVRQGLFQRLIDKGEGVAGYGSTNIANRLNKFLNSDGRDLAKVIFTPEQRNLMQQYANLHRALEIPKGGYNSSESSTFIVPMIQKATKYIAGAVGGLIGHVVAPGLHGVGEAAGAMIAAKGSETISNVANAKKIAQQMPVIERQLREWKRAVARQGRSGGSNPALAARTLALSQSLDRIGIDGSYIRQLTGPMPSAAEGDQNNGRRPRDNEPNQGAGGKSHGGPVIRRETGGAVKEALQSLKDYANGGVAEEKSPFDWSGVGEAMPEHIGREKIMDPLLTIPKRIGYDLPKELIEHSKANPLPGLRREDFTDVPADTSPDPRSPLGGVGIAAPRVGWQPVDPMVGGSLEAGMNVMGGTSLGAPAKAAVNAPEVAADFLPRFGGADAALPPQAQKAISRYVGGPHDALAKGTWGGIMDESMLEQAYGGAGKFSRSDFDPAGVRAQIEEAAGPMRDALRKQHGDYITLYRVQRPLKGDEAKRAVLSTTSDPNFAASYAGVKPVQPLFTEQQMAAADAQLQKTGEVKIGNHTLSKNEYGSYDINDPSVGGFLTDTKNAREHMENINESRAYANEENAKKSARIQTMRVPVDDVVWGTNRFGQNEFMVKTRNGKIRDVEHHTSFTLGAGAADKRGAVAAAAPQIRAYHGSPHDFDKFDLSKIGTGEGAQAYGHGLYFAEKEGTAKAYREQLAGKLSKVKEADGTFTVEELSGSQKPIRGLTETEADKLVSQPRGKMYEVNINADPAHFLDWDKPLSQQAPQVQEALKKSMGKNWDEFKHADAGTAVKQGFIAPSPEATAANLGIPGIKYLDQGSRPPRSLAETQNSIKYYDDMLKKEPGNQFAADQLKQYQADLAKHETGSRNYVVFNDKLIDILRKYGIALPGAAGAAEFVGNDQGRASGGAVRSRALNIAYQSKRGRHGGRSGT